MRAGDPFEENLERISVKRPILGPSPELDAKIRHMIKLNVRKQVSGTKKLFSLPIMACVASLLLAVGLFLWLGRQDQPFERVFPNNGGFIKADSNSIVYQVNEGIYRLEKGKVRVKLVQSLIDGKNVLVQTPNATVEFLGTDAGSVDCEITIEEEKGGANMKTLVIILAGMVQVTNPALPLEKVKGVKGDTLRVQHNQEPKKQEKLEKLLDDYLSKQEFTKDGKTRIVIKASDMKPYESAFNDIMPKYLEGLKFFQCSVVCYKNNLLWGQPGWGQPVFVDETNDKVFEVTRLGDIQPHLKPIKTEEEAKTVLKFLIHLIDNMWDASGAIRFMAVNVEKQDKGEMKVSGENSFTDGKNRKWKHEWKMNVDKDGKVCGYKHKKTKDGKVTEDWHDPVRRDQQISEGDKRWVKGLCSCLRPNAVCTCEGRVLACARCKLDGCCKHNNLCGKCTGELGICYNCHGKKVKKPDADKKWIKEGKCDCPDGQVLTHVEPADKCPGCGWFTKHTAEAKICPECAKELNICSICQKTRLEK